MLYKKKLRKLKRYIKKEFGVKYIDIKPNDTLISVSERIIMKSQNCNLEEAYKQWIIKPNLYLPGWISFMIAMEFNKETEVNQNDRIEKLFW